MDVAYRKGRKNHCHEMSELGCIAFEGAIECLFHNLAPNMMAIEIFSMSWRKMCVHTHLEAL